MLSIVKSSGLQNMTSRTNKTSAINYFLTAVATCGNERNEIVLQMRREKRGNERGKEKEEDSAFDFMEQWSLC